MIPMPIRSALDLAHRVVAGLTHSEFLPRPERGLTDVSEVNRLIARHVGGDQPCLIMRYGSTELDAICNALAVAGTIPGDGRRSLWGYVRSQCPPWWWSPEVLSKLRELSGVFPATPAMARRLAERMLDDSRLCDVLGSWRSKERFVADYLPPGVARVDREQMSPFFAREPWTLALQGQRVLVVHPFAQTIERQFARRDMLFPRPIWPDCQLSVLPAVQSLGGGEGIGYADWMEALHAMEQAMDRVDYDVALLGCGAYGLPLAAHAKRQGKKAVHVGGVLQLYFGIKGQRWERASYRGTDHDYATLYNDYWVRPSESERPAAADRVEGACYW